MKKIIKSTFREIKKTSGRFIGIFIIIAIGCAFYSGLKSVEPDMNLAAQKYYSKSNFMDFQLLSTIGFNAEDVSSVGTVNGVKTVEAGYSYDAIGNVDEEFRVVRLSSMPEHINKLQLKTGRLPQKSGECVVLAHKGAKGGIAEGDTILLSSGAGKNLLDSVKVQNYKVVGTVSSPLYITRDLGSSKIGNGKVQEIVYIPAEDFALTAWTSIYLTIDASETYPIFSEDYKNMTAKYQNDLEKLGKTRTEIRYDEIRKDASVELSDKQTEYNDNIKKLSDKKTDYNRQISDAEAKIKDAGKKLEDSEKELSGKEAQYDKSVKDLADNKSKFEAELHNRDNTLQTTYNKLMDTQKALDIQQQQLEEKKIQFASAKTEGTVLEQKLKALEEEINAAGLKLAAARQQLDQGWTEYNKGRDALEGSKIKADAEFANASEKLAQGKRSLEEAQQKLLDGRNELNKSKKELEDKKSEAENEFAKAETELTDAGIKLEDAQKKINEMEKPEWHVLDREMNAGFADFESGTQRVAGLSEILPVMFFLIAALVCLTSMTRMVDEQRTQIGTLKALGYSKSKIAFKYIFYAASASIAGSIPGLAVGFRLIPMVIFRAYKSLYTLPLNQYPIHFTFALSSAVLGTAVTVFAAWFTCNASLHAVPASLMRPQAPKAGKRLFIERSGFIWSKLKFTQKVTMRNLIRYKKRFLMTVLGVACCCALVLSGFGLKDSIRIPSERQFTNIFTYNSFIKIKDSASIQERQDIAAAVDKDPYVKASIGCLFKNIEIKNGSNTKEVTLVVPEHPDQLDRFIHLANPNDKGGIKLTERDAVLSQKTADMLGLKAGSKVGASLNEEQNSSFIDITIGAITENYLQHYIFMTPKYYEEVFGEKAEVNQLLMVQSDALDENQSKFGERMTSLDGVASIGFMTDFQKNLNDMTKSLDLIVWVILVSAGLLAFVVLYTLTTININERMREIATIKVLGFYDREVSSYIFRESYILTFLGILAGLAGGIVLHGYILQGAAVDQLMYYKQLMPLSFIYAGLMTFAFSLLVAKLLQKKMRDINMVEALKSVE